MEYNKFDCTKKIATVIKLIKVYSLSYSPYPQPTPIVYMLLQVLLSLIFLIVCLGHFNFNFVVYWVKEI